MGYSVTLSFLLFFSFFRWGSKNSHIQNLEGAKFEISLRRDMENVKSTVVHTDLGLKDTAWAGDRHLRAISKKITIIVSWCSLVTWNVLLRYNRNTCAVINLYCLPIEGIRNKEHKQYL